MVTRYVLIFACIKFLITLVDPLINFYLAKTAVVVDSISEYFVFSSMATQHYCNYCEIFPLVSAVTVEFLGGAGENQ